MAVVKEQIPLRLWINDEAHLDNFYAGNVNNIALLGYLKEEMPELLYLYGPERTGISHILISLCKDAESKGLKTQYIPLQELLDSSPEMLKHLGSLDLLCVDDIDCLKNSGLSDFSEIWQSELFHLYNNLREQRCKMVFGSHSSAAELNISLADLRSRILAGETWALTELTDQEKIAALQQRAEGRGFSVSDRVARYLIARQRRDMTSLMSLLDRLDRLSLEQKKLITLPFVKTLLEESSEG